MLTKGNTTTDHIYCIMAGSDRWWTIQDIRTALHDMGWRKDSIKESLIKDIEKLKRAPCNASLNQRVSKGRMIYCIGMDPKEPKE